MDIEKLKNSKNQYRLRALFYEWAWPDRSNVLYTLKRTDHEGYPSLYRLYMETMDPTEWVFANTYFADWAHWEALCDTEWFAPYIAQWRYELELKLRSQALAEIMAEARTNSKEAFQANKYLLEKNWYQDKSAKRGRPSNDEIRKAAKDKVETEDRISNDVSRLNIVQGGKQ